MVIRICPAAATDARQIAVIDTSTLSVVATAQGDGYPDGLAYAPEVGKVYVSDEQDGNETVVDVHTNQRIGAIAVGGEAGNTQYDPASHRIYVAVQTRNQVVAIDPTTDQVIEHHDTPGCDHPHASAPYRFPVQAAWDSRVSCNSHDDIRPPTTVAPVADDGLPTLEHGRSHPFERPGR